MKQTILAFLLVFFYNISNAQLVFVDTVNTYVEPQRPTKLDSLRVHLWIVSVGANPNEHYFNHGRAGNVSSIDGCYTPTGAATFTSHYNEVEIGTSNDTIHYLDIKTFAGPPCTNIPYEQNIIKAIKIYPQPYIDSISIFPPNPIEDDDVTVVTHASTTRPGKKLNLGYYTNITSGEIYATGCYAITDSFLQDEQYNDTLKLGKLRGGNYNFNFKAYLSDDTSVCGNRVDSSMMSKAFHVQPLLSAGSVGLDKILSIYPNPVSNTLYIRRNAILDINSVQIKDMQGRTIINQADSGSIDVSQLPKGLYFVNISSDKGAVALKFLKE